MGHKYYLTITALLILFGSLSITGCETTTRGHKVIHGPPQHAPAHGYRKKYSYHYFPSSHVYYDMNRGTYFYLEGDVWRSGLSLPSSIHVSTDEAVVVVLDTDMPYLQSNIHKNKCPLGHAKTGKGKARGRGKSM